MLKTHMRTVNTTMATVTDTAMDTYRLHALVEVLLLDLATHRLITMRFRLHMHRETTMAMHTLMVHTRTRMAKDTHTRIRLLHKAIFISPRFQQRKAIRILDIHTARHRRARVLVQGMMITDIHMAAKRGMHMQHTLLQFPM